MNACGRCLSTVARRTLLLRCFPRSAGFVRWTCLLVIYGLVVLMLFSRSTPAIILCIVGVLASLEAYFAAGRGDRRALAAYAVYMLLQSGVAVGLGAYTLSRADKGCASSRNPSSCVSVAVVTGIALLLGSSFVGTFAAFSTAAVVFAMRSASGSGTGAGGGGAAATGGGGGGGSGGGGSGAGAAPGADAAERDYERELARKLAI